MHASDKILSDLCGPSPDLAAYFESIRDGAFMGREELELDLLPMEDAVSLTKQFREFHPIVSTLRGLILDDANTSNHHVYLSLPVCAGRILYLSHDDDSRIVFPSLELFLNACRAAKGSDECLSSHHPAVAPLLPDQVELRKLVVDLLDGERDFDGTAVILSLIPSMDLSDFALLGRLASHEDFYIAEAIGAAIAQRPRTNLRSIAEICASHPHIQASAAGKRALSAIEMGK